MNRPVVVVGGGLAGLVCAQELHRAGVSFLLVEASDRVGGRLKTDHHGGFLLDHGYQVLLEAYPHARRLLNYGALGLRRFRQGARVWEGNRLGFLDMAKPVQTLLDPMLGLGDKRRLASLAGELKNAHPRDVWLDGDDQSIEAFFRARGFSDTFLTKFARPFFGGVFLDPSLRTSAANLRFVLKMFIDAPVSLPAKGMEAIPRQLAASLPPHRILEHTKVRELVNDGDRVAGVRLDSYEFIEASSVVVATDGITAQELTGIDVPHRFQANTTLYFEAPEPPSQGAYIVLNGTGHGRINEVVPLTNAQPSYAPVGRHLVAVALLEDAPERDEELGLQVRRELAGWFPEAGVERWASLRTYRIRHALLAQPPGERQRWPDEATNRPGLTLAGEYTTNSSIDGAMESGAKAADLVLKSLGRKTSRSH